MKDIFKSVPTLPPKKLNKKKTQEETKKFLEIIRERQHVLYAQGKYSLLVIFQALDCGGKDGATKAIFSSVNPQGVSVTSFKKPTDLERSYDFMWRIHKEVPAKGMIKIFNRSHYEDVLVPMANRTIEQKEVKRRFDHINDFEKLLEENGTVVLKFYLHISEEEQSKRFEERLTNPMKNWKFNPSDTETAKQWPEYRMAYGNVFNHCNAIPWHIIPADKNWYKEYLIAKKIANTLLDLDLKFPNLAK